MHPGAIRTRRCGAFELFDLHVNKRCHPKLFATAAMYKRKLFNEWNNATNNIPLKERITRSTTCVTKRQALPIISILQFL